MPRSGGNPRQRRLQAVGGGGAQGRNAALAALAQTALVKGIGRAKLSSGELFQGGAIRSAQFAPRGLGYYDAFKQPVSTVVLASSVGPVTPISAHARQPIPGDLGYLAGHTDANPMTYVLNPYAGQTVGLTAHMPQTNSKIIVFNCGSSDGQVGFSMYPKSDGSMQVDYLECSAFTGLADTSDYWHHLNNTGGDITKHSSLAQGVETIPLRGSLRMINTTEERFQGGIVRVLRYNGGLLFGHDGDPNDNSALVVHEPTVDSYFILRNMIRDSARTHHMSGRDFASAKQFNTHPADFIRSQTFSSSDTLFKTCVNPRFNTILILIDDFSASGTHTNNSYEINCQVQRAGRFAPGTLHHNNAKEVPANAELASRLSALESKSGSAPSGHKG